MMKLINPRMRRSQSSDTPACQGLPKTTVRNHREMDSVHDIRVPIFSEEHAY